MSTPLMSLNKHLRLIVAIAVLMIVAWSTQTNTASAIFGKKMVEQTGCPCFTCPSCKHTCEFESELVDAEKVCFETEEKVICIPRVVFPWQRKSRSSCRGCSDQPCSCQHNGAKTRKICVLKVKKYTCPECEYAWSPKEKDCGGCATGCCTSGGCATAPSDAAQWSAQPVQTNPVSTDYEAGDGLQAHPWSAAEPVVSELPVPK